MPCVSPFSGCSLIGPCQHGFGYEGLALGRYLDPEGFGYRYQIFGFGLGGVIVLPGLRLSGLRALGV